MRFILSIFFLLTACSGVHALTQSGSYEVFEKGSKKGLKDQTGEILIPAEYEEIGWSRGSFEVIKNVIGYKKNNQWGLISIENEVVTDPKFTQLYNGGQQLLITGIPNQATGSDRLGVIDTKGNEIIESKYTIIKINGLRATVAKKISATYNYGLVDFKGKLIIPLKYRNILYLGSLRYAVVEHSGSASIYNADGVKMLDSKIDSISSFKENYALVYDGFKVGLINKDGEVLLEPKYADIRILADSVITKEINTWYMLSAENENLGEIRAEELSIFSDSFYRASVGNMFWLANQSTEEEIITYDSIGKLVDGMAAVSKKNSWGLINKNGEQKIPLKYNEIVIHDGLALVKNKMSWSIYDSFNIKKTKAQYSEIRKSSQSLFPVKKNNHWGFINRVGEEVIHCVYDEVGEFNYSMLDVKFHNEVGVINKKGEWLILPKKIDSLKVINSDYHITYKSGLKRLIETEGNNLIYFTENPIDIKDGYILEHTSDGGLWKIDFTGRIVGGNTNSREEYEEVRAPSEGFYAIRKDGSYGFIDSQNRLRIANRYQDVGDFHYGLAAFKLLNKWGFLDKSENIVIQPAYKKVSQFYGRHAIAYTDSGAGLIDVDGNRVSSFSFDSLEHQENGKYKVYKNGKVGLLSSNGDLMINPKYDHLKEEEGGYSIIAANGKVGLVDEHGVNTIPLIYSNIIYDEANNIFLAQKKSSYQKVVLQ